MSNPVISVEKLSKRYVLGHRDEGRDALRHVLERVMRNPLRWLMNRRREARAAQKEFWALKDLSFEINQGDVVGLIGRNGAGKSTLLKVLSQITEPTTGRVRLRGRVASLLEVGTGFHQELTGRENIFLNGAILGMTKAEIKSKFDMIVAFSEVEEFLDTPVKRYSSGMYVRLAFAVAAHLEPEILIVDEVLAVGDAAFQEKCLGKMGQVSKSGRTVLFVSHNMAALQTLCSKAIYLERGTVRSIGEPAQLIQEYLARTGTLHMRSFVEAMPLGSNLVLSSAAVNPNPVESGKPLQFTLEIAAKLPSTLGEIALLLFSSQGTRLAILDLRAFGLPKSLQAGQAIRIAATVPSFSFVEGDYSLGVYVRGTGFSGDAMDVLGFTVRARQATTAHAPFPIQYRGTFDLDFHAEVQTLLPA
jgi:lipopolysaccharide transport system ATP-binding protein